MLILIIKLEGNNSKVMLFQVRGEWILLFWKNNSEIGNHGITSASTKKEGDLQI